MAAYGGGPWSTVPARSRRAEPIAPSPRGGSRGGGDDRVPGVGELAEAVDGLEIGGDGERRLDKYDMPVDVSGKGAPGPADGFEAAGLAEAVLRNVARCGYESPTPVQRYAMPIVMAGRDLMACAQTGSGKTAAFCLPVVSGLVAPAGGGNGHGPRDRGSFDRVAAKPRALVLAPTRELAAQINEEAKKFSFQTGLRVVVAYGGTPMFSQLRDLEKGVDLLVATPGRLVDLVERSRISLEAIKYLVMDEADRMLNMGFEPQIRKIVDMMNMPKKSVRQTMLFSATFPPEIQRLATDFLHNYIFVTVGRVGSSTDLIDQKIEFVNGGEKRGFLLDILQKQSVGLSKNKQPLTLVFVETKREADSLQYCLQSNGFSATSIHGDRTQQERERALKSFKSGATPILVATDVASRGLDVPNVAHVINYDLPKSIDDYVHRIGRTGRAGKAGKATALFTESNHHLAKDLLELMTGAKQDVPEWLGDYASRPCSGGSSYGGRGRRGGGGFGGRDYRLSSDYGYGGNGGVYSSSGSSYSGGGGGYSSRGGGYSGRGGGYASRGGGYSGGASRGGGYSGGRGDYYRGGSRGGGGSDGSYRQSAPPLPYPSYPRAAADISASGWD
ncbi:putative DEAD-box ATP-dependent RNA helicase family protein [Zea mays]|uniref:RNA helicase n=1 Tax=Zea mays TaxID=4577 RepID=B4F9Y2_MAIZE|nr:putative DEAD-box ATP-dependent RNA helicase family protein [Zea mays]ACF78925.1 unknown [Zea mays]AQK82336.1 DEAD-box ATP-dependent RNA helicase 52 [Zea mays]|eukprot:NP_001130628.1 putative DEAD-box ATP-dependent RNA helicase family protein [Zea mays]